MGCDRPRGATRQLAEQRRELVRRLERVKNPPSRAAGARRAHQKREPSQPRASTRCSRFWRAERFDGPSVSAHKQASSSHADAHPETTQEQNHTQAACGNGSLSGRQFNEPARRATVCNHPVCSAISLPSNPVTADRSEPVTEPIPDRDAQRPACHGPLATCT
jgi:hypothetical protein